LKLKHENNWELITGAGENCPTILFVICGASTIRFKLLRMAILDAGLAVKRPKTR
jgi:hypothetical protein